MSTQCVCVITLRGFGGDTRQILDPFMSFPDPEFDPQAAALCAARARMLRGEYAVPDSLARMALARSLGREDVSVQDVRPCVVIEIPVDADRAGG